ncbi:MAG TPA: hypothetical protein DGQ94_04360 [Pseudomonas sp.]|nr:hypothetical protein CQW31_20195 [Pseudomonas sp. 382]HCV37951.1 hypothetical protein [Pseudomonas sp.]
MDSLVGAGVPAKQAPRWMAPASPVFAGTPAPIMVSNQPVQTHRQQKAPTSRGFLVQQVRLSA